MSKFGKKVLSANINHRACLVLGSGFGLMDDIVENFPSVFIINDGDRSLRGRNIIYRRDFSDINSLNDIDFIFFDFNQSGNLKNVQPLLTRFRPVLFVEGTTPWSVDDYKYLRSYGYFLVEYFKNMHKWIIQP